MSNQKAYNIKLLVFLVVLICVSVGHELADFAGGENAGYDRKQFLMTNTIDVNKVKITGKTKETLVTFEQGKWLVDGRYPADPMRVQVFFATMNHVSVRRPAAKENFDQINSAMDSAGVSVGLYQDEILLHSFQAWGDDERNITWFRNDAGEMFIIEIPGYRSYVYGMVSMGAHGWRDKNLLSRMNWRNLGRISVQFPDSPDNSFDIVRDGGFYKVQQLATETDTTKLTDYIDRISLLNATGFIDHLPDTLQPVPALSIQVFDVGNNVLTIELFQNILPPDNLQLARSGPAEYATVLPEEAAFLFKTADYFKK